MPLVLLVFLSVTEMRMLSNSMPTKLYPELGPALMLRSLMSVLGE